MKSSSQQVGGLRPFIDALPIPGRLPETPMSAIPALAARYFDYGTPTCFTLREFEAFHQFHRDLPPTLMWTYNGTFPGPIIVHRLGTPATIRRINDLNPNYRGFGIVETVLHNHGGWQSPDDDGWPMDYIRPGEERYYFIPNQVPNNDRSHWASTIWYHDHVADHTAGNVYHGLAGMVNQFDELDSDDENDTNPLALRLPSGAFDIPLVLGDYILNRDGSLYFDQMNDSGQVGNLFCVNGKIQPYFYVARRKYRFRVLCASQARHFRIKLSNGAPFHVIASDGGLLEAPVEVTNLYIVPGERYEIIIDFSRFPLGTQLVLVNDVDQKDGNKPASIGRVAIPMMLFVIHCDAPDPSRLPAKLQSITPPDLSKVVTTRYLKFHRSKGAWMINDRFWNPDVPLFRCRLGTAERWIVTNGSGGWEHPFHLHVENYQVLSRDGQRPPMIERGRKDILNLGSGATAELYIQFHRYAGRYTVHCHNVGHEDLAMMGWIDVQP